MWNSGASFFTFTKSMVISPEVLDRGKERMFVVLFIPRSLLFNSFCFLAEIKLIPNSYFSPKILFFIEAKGKRGSLPFVLFEIMQDSSMSVLELATSSVGS